MLVLQGTLHGDLWGQGSKALFSECPETLLITISTWVPHTLPRGEVTSLPHFPPVPWLGHSLPFYFVLNLAFFFFFHIEKMTLPQEPKINGNWKKKKKV